jgi:hypothetical protein
MGITYGDDYSGAIKILNAHMLTPEGQNEGEVDLVTVEGFDVCLLETDPSSRQSY